MSEHFVGSLPVLSMSQLAEAKMEPFCLFQYSLVVFFFLPSVTVNMFLTNCTLQHGPLFPQHERNGQVRFSALPPSRISVIFSQK